MPRGKKPVDLTGRRFGRFVAISPTDKRDKKNSVIWQCYCDCGKEFERSAQRIVHGSVSCGCRQKENPGKFQAVDLAGKVFRDIEFVKPTDKRTKTGYVIWRCKCRLCERQLTKGSQAYLDKTASCRCRSWYEKYDPDRLYGRPILPNNASLYNSHWNSYRKAARKYNRVFGLSRKEFDGLIMQPCHYCGEPPIERTINKNKNPRTFAANGIDRIDSQGDYTIDNCVPCCPRCNRFKNDMTVDDFKNWIKQAYSHLFITPVPPPIVRDINNNG